MLRWMGLATALLMMAGLGPMVGGRAIADDQAKAETFFETKVRPLLVNTCLKCHGADKVSGGLRLDSREAMLEGGDSGPAVVPGDIEESLLVVAIRHDDAVLKMPPGKDSALPEQAIDDLTAWVAAGAYWPESIASSTLEGEKHWAFEPLSTTDAPEDPGGWAEAPIDRYIAAEQRKQGLQPVPQADRRALVRRLYFDLIGLPPTPEEIAAFLDDQRPDAVARLVDDLLSRPQYGERWGRYWLDLARYADTAGDNSDYPIPEAYLYRDYVIDAFNDDIPYDRFLAEQLAGDILAHQGPPEDYARQVIATGFIAHSKRLGTRELEDMHEVIEDTVNTTGQVVLGLTLRCARCHDHKFDPITAEDYYGLYGFFASTQYPFAGAEEVRYQTHFAPLILPEEVASREAQHAEAIAAIQEKLAKAENESEAAAQLQELNQKAAEAEERLKASESSAREELQKELDQLKADQSQAQEALESTLKPIRDELAAQEKRSPLEGAPIAYAVGEGTPTDVAVQIGGNPRTPGEVVPRGVPKILDPDADLGIPEGSSGRLQLAQWLTGPASHLSARVMANRIWQHHFGKAIVTTPSDFGLRGAPPTHPDLLDYLARRFIESGWSVKALHREILLSKTYQLSSQHQEENAAIDSGNDWYWRFDRQRLDAEALRDTLLSLGGNLDSNRPGPHPFPPKDKWTFTAHHQFNDICYDSNHRSVYLMVQRMQPHPYLKLFNGPDTSMTTAVRDQASVPLQALYLLNSPFLHDQARRFASRLISAESDPMARLDRAYLEAFAREPTDTERSRASSFLDQYAASLESEGVEPSEQPLDSWSALARAILASNEFLFID